MARRGRVAGSRYTSSAGPALRNSAVRGPGAPISTAVCVLVPYKPLATAHKIALTTHIPSSSSSATDVDDVVVVDVVTDFFYYYYNNKKNKKKNNYN